MEIVRVVLSGLPGKMATKVKEKVLGCDDFELLPCALTSKRHDSERLDGIELYGTQRRNEFLEDTEKHRPFIIVDYTTPDAVNENAEFYCTSGIPFVMGTTGGDREKLIECVEGSDICAVIAPNMAKQIVGLMAMFEYAATNFPGLFEGYGLEIVESHQSTKKDTSGTAKAMVKYFNKLGIPFNIDDIQKIRDPEKQREIGVPEEYLAGHGWHTYKLTSPDRTVYFEFTHNVNGRDIYALGTLDAIKYLHRKMEEGSKGRAYSMIDVLKGI
ncbi:MAG TPA: dihydrodipicolinate reductase [Candidatus Aenigmarchaeota archaeon]|nr:MAG: dihydrodipicolinate reductase [Candidatus Aenigmarchaeota archaeon]HDD46218.1 dihydrodipicolinate reductase [Candidatus Aenigmarchaeota archaeon]